MSSGGKPFTLVSCDNLPGNGDVTRRLLLQFADLKEPAVGKSIRDCVLAPNCMVDRITPAVTEDTRAFVQVRSECMTGVLFWQKSYLQWIIEDRFINGRPDLKTIVSQFTNDVAPYEQLKMRLLKRLIPHWLTSRTCLASGRWTRR